MIAAGHGHVFECVGERSLHMFQTLAQVAFILVEMSAAAWVVLTASLLTCCTIFLPFSSRETWSKLSWPKAYMVATAFLACAELTRITTRLGAMTKIPSKIAVRMRKEAKAGPIK